MIAEPVPAGGPTSASDGHQVVRGQLGRRVRRRRRARPAAASRRSADAAGARRAGPAPHDGDVEPARWPTHGAVAAQVLMVPHDFVNRRQYLHARQTLVRLLELGCVPGRQRERRRRQRRDPLRRQRPHRRARGPPGRAPTSCCSSPTWTGCTPPTPGGTPAAELIGHVAADDPILGVVAAGPGPARGSGGMASKLAAARIASWSGVRAVIARADRPDVVAEAVAGVAGHRHDVRGQRPPAARPQAVDRLRQRHRRPPRRRRRRPRGAGRAGHVVAARPGWSRSWASSTRATRSTSPIVTGVVFARGMAAADATCLRRTAGRRTSDLPADVAHEAIHRDDLVVLPQA